MLADKVAALKKELAKLANELPPEDELVRHIYRALGPLADIERELRRRGEP